MSRLLNWLDGLHDYAAIGLLLGLAVAVTVAGMVAIEVWGDDDTDCLVIPGKVTIVSCTTTEEVDQ